LIECNEVGLDGSPLLPVKSIATITLSYSPPLMKSTKLGLLIIFTYYKFNVPAGLFYFLSFTRLNTFCYYSKIFRGDP